MTQLSDFHFLHPWWLLALIPVGLLFLLLRQTQEATSQWGNIISPQLLPYLVIKGSNKQQIRPYRLLMAGLVLANLALAGPTWEREPSPFSENEAPLVIAVDLSASMNVADIQPSRLARAQQKVYDLLTLRSGGRTALIAYAGSAHLVLPLTEDTQVLASYLADFNTDIMPLSGKAPDRALQLAERLLAQETIPGSILFVTDGISTDQTAAFVTHAQHSQNEVVVLGMGTVQGGYIPSESGESDFSRLDRQGLTAIATQAQAYVTEVTTDNADVRRLNQHIQQHLSQVQATDSTQWKDEGYWLLYPLAGLMLFWARRGWTIQWLMVLCFMVCQPQSALAAEASASAYGIKSSPTLSFLAQGIPKFTQQDFINLWLTSDQQGRYWFEQGEFTKAAQHFDSPLWKGIAYYAAEEFETAIPLFLQLESPTGYFAAGNAYAHRQAYQDAIDHYDIALALNPDYAAAQHNRAVVQAALEKEKEYQKEREQQGATDEGADDIVFDDQPAPESETDESIEIGSKTLDISDEALTDLWLNNVQTTPADFLQQKFQFQLEAEGFDEPA